MVGSNEVKGETSTRCVASFDVGYRVLRSDKANKMLGRQA